MLKLGVVSRNYPPAQGGMSRHAYGFVQEVAKRADVDLFVPPPRGQPHPRARVHETLSNNVSDNIDIVRTSDVDVWLGLSAIYAPLAHHTSTPFVLYFHGNDFLHPVIDPDRHLEARLSRVPGLWRFSKALTSPLIARIVKRRQAVINNALPAVQLIFFNSTYTRDIASQLYDFGRIPLEVLYPGCDQQFFQARTARDDGVLRILTVSSLASSARRKNIDHVLEALRLIKGERLLMYTVIGSGDDRDRLQRKVQVLGIADCVRFLGNVDDQVLLQEYASNDVFVLTPRASQRDVEGFGMVYIEANAAGMPVIGSNQGGAVDAIVAGKTGLVIAESTPTQIAAAIRQLAQHPQTLSEATIRAHAERFRWSKIVERFEYFLHQHLH